MDSSVTYEDILNHERWYHRIPLYEGEYTPGRAVGPGHWQELQLPSDLSGKSFLDVGTADGLHAFEAERRGADRVLAVDIWHDDAMKQGSQMVKQYLDSDVELRQLNASDVTAETVGEFDFVLCSGLIYHIPDPYLVISNLVSVAKESLVIETSLNEYNHIKDSILQLADSDPPQPLRSVPNLSAVEKMVAAGGATVQKAYTYDYTDVRTGRNVPQKESGVLLKGSDVFGSTSLASTVATVTSDTRVDILYRDNNKLCVSNTGNLEFYGWVKPSSVNNDTSNMSSAEIFSKVEQVSSSLQKSGLVTTLHRIANSIDSSGGRGVVHGKIN